MKSGLRDPTGPDHMELRYCTREGCCRAQNPINYACQLIGALSKASISVLLQKRAKFSAEETKLVISRKFVFGNLAKFRKYRQISANICYFAKLSRHISHSAKLSFQK